MGSTPAFFQEAFRAVYQRQIDATSDGTTIWNEPYSPSKEPYILWKEPYILLKTRTRQCIVINCKRNVRWNQPYKRAMHSTLWKAPYFPSKAPYVLWKEPYIILWKEHDNVLSSTVSATSGGTSPMKEQCIYYSMKRTLYFVKRALYSKKMALYSMKRTLYLVKRALFSMKTALYSMKSALQSTKTDLCPDQRDLLTVKMAPFW